MALLGEFRELYDLTGISHCSQMVDGMKHEIIWYPQELLPIYSLIHNAPAPQPQAMLNPVTINTHPEALYVIAHSLPHWFHSYMTTTRSGGRPNSSFYNFKDQFILDIFWGKTGLSKFFVSNFVKTLWSLEISGPTAHKSMIEPKSEPKRRQGN